MASLFDYSVKKSYVIPVTCTKICTEIITADIPPEFPSSSSFPFTSVFTDYDGAMVGRAVYDGPFGGGRQYIYYRASVQLDLSSVIADLNAGPTPYYSHSIYKTKITDAGGNTLFDTGKYYKDDNIDTPNVNNLENETPYVGEGTPEQINARLLTRLISDMFKDKSAGRILSVANNETDETNQAVVCGNGSYPYAASCNMKPVSSTVTIDIYLIPNTLDLPEDISIPEEKGPIDDTGVTPETEKITDNITPEEGLNEDDIRDNGGITTQDSGGGIDVKTPTGFDTIYIPESVDVDNLPGVVIGVDIIAGSESGYGLTHTNVFIKSITQSMNTADSMIFVEQVKYDETGIFNIGDKVFGLVYGTTRFRGWIKSKQRIINESDQYIQYEASGIRGWLNTLPFATQYKVTENTIQQIATSITAKLPRAIINERLNLTSLPTTIIPKFEIESASFGYALDAILDYARKYQYYIDHTGTFRILDLENLTVVNLSMPTEGDKLSEHPEYTILSKDLSVDVSNCRTRIILRGDYPIQEHNDHVSASWEYTKGSVIGTISLGKKILPSLLSNNSMPVYIYTVLSGNVKSYWNLVSVDCDTGEIKFTGPSGFYMYIRYCTKDELNPIKYDSGWKGTAYTDYKIQQVITQQDSRFKKIILPEGAVRDDSSYLESYANSILESQKDWKIGGSIVLNGLNVNTYIGTAVKILNSNSVELLTAEMAVMQVTWDFENMTTSLSVTNDYYVGTAIPDQFNDEKYDERKLIEKLMLASHKINQMPWVSIEEET